VQNLGVPALRALLTLLVVALGMGSVALGLAWGTAVAIGFASG